MELKWANTTSEICIFTYTSTLDIIHQLIHAYICNHVHTHAHTHILYATYAYTYSAYTVMHISKHAYTRQPTQIEKYTCNYPLASVCIQLARWTNKCVANALNLEKSDHEPMHAYTGTCKHNCIYTYKHNYANEMRWIHRIRLRWIHYMPLITCIRTTPYITV